MNAISVKTRGVQHRQHLTRLPASTDPMMRERVSASPNSWAIGIVPKYKSVALPTSCRTHSYAAQDHQDFWITIMGTRLLVVFAAILAAAWGNRGHHGNHGSHHHHSHSSTSHQQPLISSFSHKLPGTNSYMSVTRYFNSRPNVDDGQLLHQENQSQRQGHAVQDNGFHPWNPRFQVLLRHFKIRMDRWHLKSVWETNHALRKMS